MMGHDKLIKKTTEQQLKDMGDSTSGPATSLRQELIEILTNLGLGMAVTGICSVVLAILRILYQLHLFLLHGAWISIPMVNWLNFSFLPGLQVIWEWWDPSLAGFLFVVGGITVCLGSMLLALADKLSGSE